MSILFLTGCKKDCPDGFSGEDCEVRESEHFLGSYEGFVNCGFIDEYTTLDILGDTGPFAIKMEMAYPPDFKFSASVREDTLIIPEQVVAVPNGQDSSYYILFDSKGIISSDTLDFELILLFPGIPEQEKVICSYHVLK